MIQTYATQPTPSGFQSAMDIEEYQKPSRLKEDHKKKKKNKDKEKHNCLSAALCNASMWFYRTLTLCLECPDINKHSKTEPMHGKTEL